MKTSPEIRFDPRRILVPTDFSEPSRLALATAGALARQFGSSLAVINVVARGDLDALLAVSPGTTLNVRSRVKAKLQDFVENELGETIQPTRIVVAGVPFHEICRKAAAWAADLIVIATLGHTGLKHVLLGSTAERVLRYAPCPVLVVRSRKNRRAETVFPPPVRSILAAVDFSASSLDALSHALGLARRYNAQLCLLHVTPPLQTDMYIATTDIQRSAQQAAQQRFDQLTGRTKKLWPHTGHELRRGHPVATIVAMAQRTNADLIVMGTHGRTGFTRSLLGSVAERVVREAPCSVLVVRQPGKT